MRTGSTYMHCSGSIFDKFPQCFEMFGYHFYYLLLFYYRTWGRVVLFFMLV